MNYYAILLGFPVSFFALLPIWFLAWTQGPSKCGSCGELADDPGGHDECFFDGRGGY